MGRPVPFHINTIKNASKSDEGEWSFLRVNFLSPGQGVGRKDDQPFEDASAHFVRSLTFRSTDGDRYAEIANQISNMKRDAVKKEQEKKDMEDVVEQDKLVEIRSKCFFPVAKFIETKPNILFRSTSCCVGQCLYSSGNGGQACAW
jgi:nucleosome binding factor SPN SPT16 subunit